MEGIKQNNMDTKELKAKAYDLLANIDFLQRELQKVNQQIAEISQKSQIPVEEIKDLEDKAEGK
jgi:cell division protein FtsB